MSQRKIVKWTPWEHHPLYSQTTKPISECAVNWHSARSLTPIGESWANAKKKKKKSVFICLCCFKDTWDFRFFLREQEKLSAVGFWSRSISSSQCFSSRVKGSFCLLESTLCWERSGRHCRPSHQWLPLPALPVSRHHVPVALQSHPGVSRRADVTHAHPHRESSAKPG